MDILLTRQQQRLFDLARVGLESAEPRVRQFTQRFVRDRFSPILQTEVYRAVEPSWGVMSHEDRQGFLQIAQSAAAKAERQATGHACQGCQGRKDKFEIDMRPGTVGDTDDDDDDEDDNNVWDNLNKGLSALTKTVTAGVNLGLQVDKHNKCFDPEYADLPQCRDARPANSRGGINPPPANNNSSSSQPSSNPSSSNQRPPASNRSQGNTDDDDSPSLLVPVVVGTTIFGIAALGLAAAFSGPPTPVRYR